MFQPHFININKYLYSFEEMDQFSSSLQQTPQQQQSQNQLKYVYKSENVNFLQPGAIDQLYKARDKLREFAGKIGEQKYSPLRKDVIEHCQKIDLQNKQFISYEQIEKMTKERIEKMIKNKKIKKNWGKDDICILIWVISKYSNHLKIHQISEDLKQDDWNKIAECIPGVTGKSCKFRWLSLHKDKLADKSWSDSQSLLLNKLVQKYGRNNWSLLSQQLYNKNICQKKVYRSPKQCKQRWSSFLKDNLRKGFWNQQEDYILMKQIKERNGSKKWTEIALKIPTRTENALKNRYNLLIDKQRKMIPYSQNMTQCMLVEKYLERTYVTQFVHERPKQERLKQSFKKVRQTKEDYILQRIILQPSSQRMVLRNRKSKKQKKNQIIDYSPKIQQNHIIQFNSSDNMSVINNSTFLKLTNQNFLQQCKLSSSFKDDQKQIKQMNQNWKISQYNFPNKLNQKNSKNDILDLNNIKVVTIQADQCYQQLKKLIKQNQCSIVPYQYKDNKLIQFNQLKD